MTRTKEPSVSAVFVLSFYHSMKNGEPHIERMERARAQNISPAWRAEIARRCEDLDRGLVQLRPAEEALSEAYRSLDGAKPSTSQGGRT